MGESSILLKIVLCVGILFVFVSVIYPAPIFIDEPPQSTAWDSFSDSISQGPQFPTFVDPFVGNTYSHIRIPISNGTDDLPDSVSGCTIADYWECVQFRDDGRFLTIESGDLVTVNITDLPSPARVITDIVVRVSCRTNGDSETAVILYHETELTPDVIVGSFFFLGCNVGSFQEIAFSFSENDPATTARWDWSGIDTGWEIGIEIHPNLDNGPVLVDYMEAQVFSQDVVTCAADPGAWFPWVDEQACAIGQFTQLIFHGFQFIFNGISFVVVSIGAIMLYISIAVGGLFTGLITTFGFFIALPGAPPLIQTSVAVIFVAFIAFIAFVLIKIVRGTGTIG